MCGIFGYIDHNQKERLLEIQHLLTSNSYRGFDTWNILHKSRLTKGVNIQRNNNNINNVKEVFDKVKHYDFVIGNFKSHSLSETPVKNIEEDFPFLEGGRTYIIHHGIISNHAELAKKYNLSSYVKDSQVIARLYNLNILATNNNVEEAVQRTCRVLEGSFAFILYDIVLDKVIIVKNYQPLNIHYSPMKYFYFGSESSKQNMFEYVSLPAYTSIIINPHSILIEKQFKIENNVASKHIPKINKDKCVVVCSGGLDSSVSAFIAKNMLKYNDIIILNMNLGQRGWRSEKKSAQIIAQKLKAQYKHLDIRNIFKNFTKTPLTDYNKQVATGINSSESPTEWVVMRNTILSSITSGIAETYGAAAIITGCNLEEESAYPDNSITWIDAFSNMLQHGSLYGIKMLPIVSHLMKKDIVLLGSALGVPFQHTTSCYDPLDIKLCDDLRRIKQAQILNLTHIPCGKCGCCCLRRHAFLSARIKDPYESLYLYNMEPFESYNYFMEQIKERGYININDEEWQKNIINIYKDRIFVGCDCV